MSFPMTYQVSNKNKASAARKTSWKNPAVLKSTSPAAKPAHV